MDEQTLIPQRLVNGYPVVEAGGRTWTRTLKSACPICRKSFFRFECEGEPAWTPTADPKAEPWERMRTTCGDPACFMAERRRVAPAAQQPVRRPA